MNPDKTFFNILRMCVYEIFFYTLFSKWNDVFAISPKHYILGQKYVQIVIFDMPNASPKRAWYSEQK